MNYLLLSRFFMNYKADFEKGMAKLKGKLRVLKELAKNIWGGEKEIYLSIITLFKRVTQLDVLGQGTSLMNKRIDEISERVRRLEEELNERRSMR